MNDQKFVKVSDLFRCETCYHTSPKGCALGAFACDLGEAYRPSISLLPTFTLDDLRPKGRWLTWSEKFPGHKVERGVSLGVFCSLCQLHADNISDFCPSCGADMRGDGEDA